jgi:hypothetical protein
MAKFILSLASDANQLNCMKKVSSKVMEEAVIKNNAQFGLVADSTFCHTASQADA